MGQQNKELDDLYYPTELDLGIEKEPKKLDYDILRYLTTILLHWARK